MAKPQPTVIDRAIFNFNSRFGLVTVEISRRPVPGRYYAIATCPSERKMYEWGDEQGTRGMVFMGDTNALGYANQLVEAIALKKSRNEERGREAS